MAEKDEGEKTIAEDLVVTKYKMAGDIVNRKYSHGASKEPFADSAAPQMWTGGPFEKCHDAAPNSIWRHGGPMCILFCRYQAAFIN
jgi:hypothetical protein